MADSLEQVRASLAGQYRIERELGQGGMATVYLAEDLKHHRQVAIKVLDPELAGALGQERFLREIRTAAGLQHPHILPLLDSGASGSLFFYVMPYVEGESLRARLETDHQLGQEEAVRLGAEVARALDYAHRTASSTATSSPRTSCSPTDRRWWPTWASPARSVSRAANS